MIKRNIGPVMADASGVDGGCGRRCKGTYPSDPSDPPSPLPSASDTLRIYVSISLSFNYHFIIYIYFHPPIGSSVGPSVFHPSDPIMFIHPSSVLYSFIVRYLFILFPEPSTACPRVRLVYIRLLNTCYGFPQINSLWIPLTGQFPLP